MSGFEINSCFKGCYDPVEMESVPDETACSKSGGGPMLHSDELSRQVMEDYARGAYLQLIFYDSGKTVAYIRFLDKAQDATFFFNEPPRPKDKRGADEGPNGLNKLTQKKKSLSSKKITTIKGRTNGSDGGTGGAVATSARRDVDLPPEWFEPKLKETEKICESGLCGGCIEPPCVPCSLEEVRSMGKTSVEWAIGWIQWFYFTARSDEKGIAISHLSKNEELIIRYYKEKWRLVENFDADLANFDWRNAKSTLD